MASRICQHIPIKNSKYLLVETGVLCITVLLKKRSRIQTSYINRDHLKQGFGYMSAREL